MKVKQTVDALAAKAALWLRGARPVPPLEDGRDLWADEDRDGDVYAYTPRGEVRVVMARAEYDERRRAMVEAAVQRWKQFATRITGDKSDEGKRLKGV